jgi:outer membrane lipoprotein-sorting protein
MAETKRFLITLLSLALALPVLAGDSSLSGTGQLESVIKNVMEQQKNTNTLEADFRQEKVMALMASPEVSTGSFVFAKPNQVLWKYDAPKQVTMLIADGFLTTYYPNLNKAERVEVKKYQDRIFKYMGATGAIDELARYFDFTFTDSAANASYVLDLSPKTHTIARRAKHIKIWIDKKSYLTTKFEYVEGDGDTTRYEFTNLRINKPVAADRFALNLPSTVHVEQMKLN